MTVGAELVAHHLRLFGVRASAECAGPVSEDVGETVQVRAIASSGDSAEIRRGVRAGRTVVALVAGANDIIGLGCTIDRARVVDGRLQAVIGATKRAECPPTLHHVHALQCARLNEPIVVSLTGEVAWTWIPGESNRSGVLLVGTDLAGDLVRFRQGDPARADERELAPLWGYEGERPVYLFERQLEGLGRYERPADEWCTLLVEVLRHLGAVEVAPLLPNGAPGALVVTGDDDQARVSSYERQLELLANLPITYFLHPGCRLSGNDMRRLFSGRRIDLGLHPDALEDPQRYSSRFDEQAAWFRTLVGEGAVSVRNHGYLNDGYWGHASDWLRHGVRISSNIPGQDGRVLTGSLLPARVALDGRLTDHWSVLTAIGDGIMFALGMSATEARDCVLSFSERVRSSRIPGLLVLNLHPDNVETTSGMHEAVREIAADGFIAWHLRDCLEWFDARDRSLQ